MTPAQKARTYHEISVANWMWEKAKEAFDCDNPAPYLRIYLRKWVAEMEREESEESRKQRRAEQELVRVQEIQHSEWARRVPAWTTPTILTLFSTTSARWRIWTA
jgi:hypothetical protein